MLDTSLSAEVYHHLQFNFCSSVYTLKLLRIRETNNIAILRSKMTVSYRRGDKFTDVFQCYRFDTEYMIMIAEFISTGKAHGLAFSKGSFLSEGYKSSLCLSKTCRE